MEGDFDPKSTTRFSSRVENYVRYRPGYPDEVLECLQREIGLAAGWVIADIGSGTGILAEKFLKRGYRVIGVEPNDDMRSAAEKLLSSYPAFTSVKGTAEGCSLEDAALDLVVAGQAFHWFDVRRAHSEFGRILKSNGWVALVWNTRQTAGTAFLQGYERLLQRYSIDYRQVDHRNVTEASLAGLFSTFQKRVFPNSQEFDFEGLKGRLLSSSYAPLPGDGNYPPMMDALEKLFSKYQTRDTVTFLYDTELYFGRI